MTKAATNIQIKCTDRMILPGSSQKYRELTLDYAGVEKQIDEKSDFVFFLID